jgi:hypothetical protein
VEDFFGGGFSADFGGAPQQRGPPAPAAAATDSAWGF